MWYSDIQSKQPHCQSFGGWDNMHSFTGSHKMDLKQQCFQSFEANPDVRIAFNVYFEISKTFVAFIFLFNIKTSNQLKYCFVRPKHLGVPVTVKSWRCNLTTPNLWFKYKNMERSPLICSWQFLTLLSPCALVVARDFNVWIFSKTKLTFLFVVSSLSLLLQTHAHTPTHTY